MSEFELLWLLEEGLFKWALLFKIELEELVIGGTVLPPDMLVGKVVEATLIKVTLEEY